MPHESVGDLAIPRMVDFFSIGISLCVDQRGGVMASGPMDYTAVGESERGISSGWRCPSPVLMILLEE